jgi:hypothetical protein
MIIQPATQWQEELSFTVLDGQFVDTGKATCHEAPGVELPVLVAIGTKPLARVVVAFVSKVYGHAVAIKRTQYLDQRVT